jgi:hypothetical protein
MVTCVRWGERLGRAQDIGSVWWGMHIGDGVSVWMHDEPSGAHSSSARHDTHKGGGCERLDMQWGEAHREEPCVRCSTHSMTHTKEVGTSGWARVAAYRGGEHEWLDTQWDEWLRQQQRMEEVRASSWACDKASSTWRRSTRHRGGDVTPNFMAKIEYSSHVCTRTIFPHI